MARWQLRISVLAVVVFYVAMVGVIAWIAHVNARQVASACQALYPTYTTRVRWEALTPHCEVQVMKKWYPVSMEKE